MTEPFFDDATERMYARLPGVYRFEDANHNWTLKRYMSGIGVTLEELNVLIDRFTYTPLDDGYKETPDLHSDLVDPMNADVAWLPWLAQLVGVNFDFLLSEASQRMRIANALDGAQPGTEAAIIQAAQTVLTGSKTVFVYPRSNDVGGVGAGTQWEILIKTLTAETTGDVVAAVTNLGAKPAGIKLYHQAYGATWDTIAAAKPTWADWDASTWQDLETL